MLVQDLLLEDFGKWLIGERQVSEGTATKYQRVARKFVAAHGHPSSVTRKAIEAWYQTTQEGEGKQAAASTVNIKLAAIHSFYKYLMVKGVLESDPTSHLTPKKVKKRLPRPLSRNVLETLFSLVYEQPGTMGLQDRVVFECLYGSGLRREEAGAIRLGDIYDASTLRIREGKGDKERLAIITDPQYKAMVEWATVTHFDERAHGIAKDQDAVAAFVDLCRRKPTLSLFISEGGNPVADLKHPGAVIYQRVVFYNKLLGEKITPHEFRHSYATHLIEDGADILAVKDSMGHESIQTTMQYVKVARNKALDLIGKHRRQRASP
jgi:integrase/recombinase XerD